MKTLLTVSAALFVSLSFLGVNASAESNNPAACEAGEVAYIWLNAAPPGVGCPTGFTYQCVIPSGFQFVYVQVLSVPFQKIRFTLPDPPQGTVAFEQWSFPFTGNRLTGVEMDMGGCTTGENVCLGFIAVIAEPVGCPPWYVPFGSAEIQDCDGVWHPAQSVGSSMGCDTGLCFQVCPGLRPYDLYPPDGAQSVGLNVALTWTASHQFSYCNVRIGTDPDCEGVRQVFDVDCSTQSFSPDFLQPETTYYWQVFTAFDACHGGGLSSLHSFTTEGPVSATPTTWGRVKVMYSD